MGIIQQGVNIMAKKKSNLKSGSKTFKSAEDKRKYEAYKHIHICRSKSKKK